MTPPPPAPTPATKPLLVVRNLVKAFPNGANVLNGVSLDVFPGDVFTVLGGSGCGKSTLLNILIGVDEPTSGTVHVLGQNIHSLPRRQRKRLMRDVALPFQQHHPKISRDHDLLEDTVLMKLRAVKLDAHAQKYPRELSGGMKKRAALARALALDPRLLISDEPTSGLDPVSTKQIDDLTITLSRKSGSTVLLSGSREDFFASEHPLVRGFFHLEEGGAVQD